MDKTAQIAGIDFYWIKNSSFKSNMLEVAFFDELSHERSYKNALIENVLWRGCGLLPTQRALSKRCRDLYGTLFFCGTEKIENLQWLAFDMDYLNRKYIGNSGIDSEAFDILLSVLTDPLTENRGNSFKKDFFEAERINQNNVILGKKNEKFTLAMTRFFEEMYPGEAFSLDENGALEDGRLLTPESLYVYYREHFLKKLCCRVICVGAEKPDRLIDKFGQVSRTGILGTGQRELIKFGSSSRKISEKVKHITEDKKCNTAKLFMGFKADFPKYSKYYFALKIASLIFGGGDSSKLFLTLREKCSLVYHISSSGSFNKENLLVAAELDKSNLAYAEELVISLFDEMRQGAFSENDLRIAKSDAVNSLVSARENQASLINFNMRYSFLPFELSIDEAIEGYKNVTKEDICEVCKKITLDTVYEMI